jgi:hypothetical protein
VALNPLTFDYCATAATSPDLNALQDIQTQIKTEFFWLDSKRNSPILRNASDSSGKIPLGKVYDFRFDHALDAASEKGDS